MRYLFFIFVSFIFLAQSCKKKELDFTPTSGEIKKTKESLMAHTWLMDSARIYTQVNNQTVTIVPAGYVKLIFGEDTYMETSDTSSQVITITNNYRVINLTRFEYWPVGGTENDDMYNYIDKPDDSHLELTDLAVSTSNASVTTYRYYSAQ